MHAFRNNWYATHPVRETNLGGYVWLFYCSLISKKFPLPSLFSIVFPLLFMTKQIQHNSFFFPLFCMNKDIFYLLIIINHLLNLIELVQNFLIFTNFFLRLNLKGLLHNFNEKVLNFVSFKWVIGITGENYMAWNLLFFPTFTRKKIEHSNR